MGYGVIVREQSIAANTTVENVFAGSQFEIMTDPSIVSLGETASATGLISQINVGARLLKEAAPPVIRTAMPVQPDDFFFNAPALPQDRLQARVQNTTGGALTYRVVAQIAAPG